MNTASYPKLNLLTCVLASLQILLSYKQCAVSNHSTPDCHCFSRFIYLSKVIYLPFGYSSVTRHLNSEKSLVYLGTLPRHNQPCIYTIMRLRVRGPSGMSQVTMPDDATWGQLKAEISSKTSVPDFDIKYGYPPKALDTTSFDHDLKLSDVGINLSGEQLIIMPRDIQSKLSNPMSGSAPHPVVAGTLPPQNNVSPPKHQAADFPSGSNHIENKAAPLSLTRKPKDATEDPPEIPVPAIDGVMTLRVMPDDNSCMFRALGSAVLGDALDGMNEVCFFNLRLVSRSEANT